MTAFMSSEIIIMVERNLGFEAEHHHRALNGLLHTASVLTTVPTAMVFSPRRMSSTG